MRSGAAIEAGAKVEVGVAIELGAKADTTIEPGAVVEPSAAAEVGATITCRRVGMRSEAAVEVELAPTWAPAQAHEANPDWQTVDRALRTIALRRAALDADEARWLREAEALQIFEALRQCPGGKRDGRAP